MLRNKYFRIASLVNFIFFACSKPMPSVSSNEIRYSITGNFTGTLYASYTTSTGGTTNEQIMLLPWNKAITYDPNVTAAVIAISGNGGVAGQQVTVVVLKGSSSLSTTQAIADGSGSFTKSAPVITF